MRRWFFIFISVFLLCSIGYSWAQEVFAEPLTLSSALKTAFDSNPRMVQAREAVKASEGQRLTNSRWDNPQVEIEPDRISVKQPFAPLGVRYLKGRIAKNEVLLQQELLREVWADVYFQVREAYTAIMLGQKLKELEEQNLKAMRQFFSHVQMRYQSGRLPQNQMQRARVELLSTQSASLKAAGELEIAQARLNLLLGRLRGASLEITGTLEDSIQLPSLDELLKKTMVQSPVLRTQQLKLESARYAYRSQQLSRLPSFAVGVSQTNQKDDDDTDNNTAVLLEVSVPLWTFFNQGAVHQARAEEAIEASRLDGLLKTLDFEVFRLYQEAEMSFKQSTLAAAAQKEAQDMFAFSSVRYQEGDMPFTEYLEQLKATIQARMQYYNTLYTLNHKISELEKTVHGSLRKEEFLQ